MMENLTKVTLNTQIVAMRNLLKKVTAFTISGLIKKSRKLKLHNAAENEPSKKDKKSDRILLEILEIKKLNTDEITKFALMYDSTFSEVAKKGSIKDRALARLAEHKLLKTTVAEFRAKYPKWKVQVPSLFRIWEFNKKMIGKNLRQPLKDGKDEIISKHVEKEESPKKKQCTKKSNKTERKKNIKPESSKMIAIELTECEAETEDDHDQEESEIVDDHCQESEIEDDNGQEESEIEDDHDVVRPSLAMLSKDLKSKQTQDLKKIDGEMEILRFNLKDVSTEIPIKNASKFKPKSDEKIAISKKRKAKNAFFLTSDDEEPVVSDDELVKHQFNSCDDNDVQVQPKRLPANRSKNLPRRLLPKEGNRDKGKAAAGSQKKATEVLHPSWEAKRKQTNSMSVAFAGKKIKFDD